MWLHNCLGMIFLVHIVSSEIRIDPLVNTNVGLIRGLRANDGDYSMFLGIPFAKVDVNNPFGPSTPYPEFEKPLRNAPIVISEYLGLPTNNLEEAIEFLTQVDSHLVIAAVNALQIADDFRPCIEKEMDGVESFITENWITASLPKVKNIPILIGFNNDEWYGFYTSEQDEFYKDLNVVEEYISKGFDVSDVDFEVMEDMVRHFYFGDEPMSAAVRQGIVDFIADFVFIHPTHRSIRKYLNNDVGNVYLYMFTYVGERNFLRKKDNVTTGAGALHCDEIGYLFDISYMKGLPITPADQLLIDQITTMWTNFVKSGNPMSQNLDNVSVQWTPITNTLELPYLNIGAELTLDSRPFNQRASFWDLFYKVNEHLQIVYPSAKVEL
ncbi:unnamed protein product [Arctia plantaginis]|uniref:Carboxylesterase type B domain-containing protein n=1 Tax=Arctia plantaginis TaxID=874455 RepID=A0A8S0YR79_ARCPL|nr:unnamed protein product [Arctia plantaginis]